jgi:hypothetical protein
MYNMFMRSPYQFEGPPWLRHEMFSPHRHKDTLLASSYWEPTTNDERFVLADFGLTIFLSPDIDISELDDLGRIEDLTYVDSYQLASNSEKANYAHALALALNHYRLVTARSLEEALKTTLQDPSIDLKHIIAGVIPETGDAYQVFGYTSCPEL